MNRQIQDGEIWIRTDEMTAPMVITEVAKADHVTDVTMMDHVMVATGTGTMTEMVDVMDLTVTDADLTVVRRAEMTHLKPLRRTKLGVSSNHVTSVWRRNCLPVPCPESISISTMIFQYLQVVKMFQNLLKIFSLAVWDQLLPKTSNWQITPSQPQSKNGPSQLSTRVGTLCRVPKPVPEKLLPSLCPCSGTKSLIGQRIITHYYFSQIFHNPGKLVSNRSRKAYPLALVLSPTRELTMQIYQEARKEWFYIRRGTI